MNLFLTLAFLFFMGSILGWVLELFFRRIISKTGEWINPGFLVGPYLPLYGFGLCIFYLLSQIDLNSIWTIFIMMVAVTAIEYLAGIIFIKGMGVKLWDYSNEWGNVDGLICPLYMLIWGILGGIYYYFVNPYVLTSLSWLEDNLAFSFFIGLFFGVIIIDVAYSTRIVVRIRKFARENQLIIKYEEFKTSIAQQRVKNKERYSFVFAISNNVKAIEEHLNEYMKMQLKRTDKIKKTVHLFIKDKVRLKKKSGDVEKNESSNSKS